MEKKQETTLLVAIEWQNNNLYFEESLEELKNLAKTAGLLVKDIIVQKREKPDPVYLIGKGKLEEINTQLMELDIDCLIFEDSLTPAQQSNLINYLNIKVLDRTGLILDIFAQRANSKEGKLQVELAQLNYLLPRLKGKGTDLSRLGGGVGTRGPGETKLESDRRHIRRKIQKIERELQQVKKHREVFSSERNKNQIPLISLVGYTNAGKSTLLNTLADTSFLAEDKLFATLDPVTRRITFDKGQEILLTDTVGFINNIPHQLISAFRATLEEIRYSDLLLHIVDISNENSERQVNTVKAVLKELEIYNKPTILVLNKIDKVKTEIINPFVGEKHCFISAQTGEGLDLLKNIIQDFFFKKIIIDLFIPYEDSYWINTIYNIGEIIDVNYQNNGMSIKLKTCQSLIPNKLQKYSR